MNKLRFILVPVLFAAVLLAQPTPANAQTAPALIGIEQWSSTNYNISAKSGMNDPWTSMGSYGSLFSLKTAGNRVFAMPYSQSNGGYTLYGRELNGSWRTLATGIQGYDVSDNLIVIWQSDPMGGSIIRAKAGLDDQWTPIISQAFITTGTGSVKVSGNRIAYSSGNNLRVKDGISGLWYNLTTGSGAGSGLDWDISPQYVVMKQGTSTVYGWTTLSGPRTTLANNFSSVTQVKVAGTRIGVLAGTVLKVKDGMNGYWYDMQSGIINWDISPQYIVIRGVTGDPQKLQVKQGLTDFWTDLGTNYGYEIPFVYGTRIAYWRAGTLYGWADKNAGRVILQTNVSNFSIGPNQ